MPEKDLFADFSRPGNEFRGVPFWSLNGELDAKEMRRQIREMKKMGFGGFFLHSRSGMAVPYLSEKWFRLVGAAIDEAQKNGLSAWLYDEDRWPSGSAGGFVTKDEKHRVRYLVCRIDENKSGGQAVASFAATFRGGSLLSYRKIGAREKVRRGEKRLDYFLVIGKNDPWFNHQCYIDALSPEAVGRFLELTHDAYFCRFKTHFGKTVPGIFTDEPNFNAFPGGKTLPWTGSLPASFLKNFGYDLREKLPELSFRLAKEDFSPARLDFRNHLSALFDDAFARQIGTWCARHRLKLAGHLLGEDTLGKQTRNVGSAMRFYHFMQMPGVDLLTEHEFFFNTVKQCVSVAHQQGKTRRLTELYGCTGWDFPFAGYKALGEWQYALGINFRCLHHSFYTLKGAAKRDYPASIFYQSPWAEKFSAVEDRFARLGAALTPGCEVRDLLVVSPLESAFGRIVDAAEPPENAALVALTDKLLALHLDFDFGDEKILAGKGKVSGKNFIIGKARYRAVLVPEMATIRKTTLALLEKFCRTNDAVFCVGDAPPRMDGVFSDAPQKVFARFRRLDDDDLDGALSPLTRRVRIVDSRKEEIASALYLFKKSRDRETLFVCNTSFDFRDRFHAVPRVTERKLVFPDGTIRWKIPASRRIFELDPSDGTHREIPTRREQRETVFDCPLAALGSRLFVAIPEKLCKKAKLHSAAAGKVFRAKRVVLENRDFPVALDEPNVLVLDRFECTADGEKVSGGTLRKIDDALRETLGETPRAKLAAQPWCATETVARKGLTIELVRRIECRRPPRKNCFLALEDPALYTEISFNGHVLPRRDDGFWCDRAIRKIRIESRFFRPGENELRLVRRYDASQPGLEDMFLLGDFGVYRDAIGKPVETLRFGDWTKQGLPYYAGNVAYTLALPDGAGKIVFGDWRGAAMEISAKSGKTVLLGWPPFEADVSGQKSVEVKIFGSRRNAFGPFYFDDRGKPTRRGAPAQFDAADRAEKELVPSGLTGAPEIFFP